MANFFANFTKSKKQVNIKNKLIQLMTISIIDIKFYMRIVCLYLSWLKQKLITT